MQISLLKLFNAVEVDNKELKAQNSLERTIKNGYILHPAIVPTNELLDSIENVVGISGEKANGSFHKSWLVIQDASIEQLVIQQIVHYITVYGFEKLGIYSESTIYIPNEVLELPEVENIPLTVIKAMTHQEILEAIINLGSGIALAQETLDAVMVIVEGSKFDKSFVEQIKNKELKILLSDYYGIVPQEPVEFLRYVVSKLTNESLLIKNKQLIDKIKASNGKFLDELMKSAPPDLASIFFRFKPLLLAMKSISRNKTFFNQLRKQANKLHKPLPEDYLNDVTNKIKHQNLGFLTFASRVEKASIFRKIRLAYALQFRLNSPEAIIYKVRNGRGWVTDFEWNENDITEQALQITLSSIAQTIKKNVENKVIYIPENVHYALPATEKQFTGNLPTGTYVSVPQDLIVGIHWFNTEDKRVDLDLSVVGARGKIGWDWSYRTESRYVLFSGDMTSAPQPNGATELFYLKTGYQEPKILFANYYNFGDDDKVDCKILVAKEKPENFGKNYMVDVSNIVASANITISKKQNILGLITTVKGENRVYFANVSIGNTITSSCGERSTQTREYLMSSLINSIDFKEILIEAGAKIVDTKPSEGEFINLSPESLDKTTIIDLMKE